MPLWKKILVGFGAVWVVGVVASLTMSSGGQPETKSATESKSAEPKTPTLSRIASRCGEEWERAFARSLKDPSSLTWDRKSAEFGAYKKNTPVVIVPYRAKNGFGALDLHQAVCQINPENGDVVSVIK